MNIKSDVSDLTKGQSGIVRFSQVAEWCLVVLSIVGTVAVILWLLVYSSYGFEFTDEGFYLVWGESPKQYHSSLTQFGYIYYPLNLLLGGDIAWLRRANVLIVFALSWFLVDIVTRDVFSADVNGRIKRYAVSLGFAIGGLGFFSFWVLSPSYNSLNFQALLIVASGLCLTEKKINKQSAIGWGLIAIGGWLVFMAKPTSAALVAGCVFFCLLLARKINIRMMLICAVFLIFLLVLSSLLIDGSIPDFVVRLQTAMTRAEHLGGGHSVGQLLRIDDFLLTQEDIFYFRIVLAIGLIVPVLLYVDNLAIRLLGLLFSGLLLLVIIIFIMARYVLSLQYGGFHGLLILAVPVAMLILSYFFYSRRFLSKFSMSQVFVALVLALFPHVYAFGSNNNYWMVGSLVGFFWLLAGLVIIVPSLRGEKASFIMFPLVLVTQLVVVILLQSGMASPYRQPQSIRLNAHPVELGRNNSRLLLSEGYAVYLTDAITAARQAGFQPGTSVIDLSGQSPGMLYALGATSIGQAWIIGGYPGSFKVATEVLKAVPCEQLASAWLLTEPEGPRSISDSLIASFGAELKDYDIVASWNTAKGAGGYEQRPGQNLLKPIQAPDVLIKKCLESRNFSIHDSVVLP